MRQILKQIYQDKKKKSNYLILLGEEYYHPNLQLILPTTKLTKEEISSS